MTKKQFVALADAIRPVLPRAKWERERVVEALAAFCGRQNPRFLRQRWIDYLYELCGPNGGAR